MADDPESAVRELLEAEAGEGDTSACATGRLAELLRIVHETGQHREHAAHTLEVRRLEVARLDGDRATVRVDATLRFAWRQNGAWQPFTTSRRGLAVAERVDGDWRVTDYPQDDLSLVDSMYDVQPESPGAPLALDAAITDYHKATGFWLVARNGGDREITIRRFELDVPMLLGPPMRLVHQLEPATLAPGESHGYAVSWHGPYRPRRGSVALAGDEARASARFSAPWFGPWRFRARRVATMPRVFELLAVALGVLALVSDWTSLLAGLALIWAGDVRGIYMALYLLDGARGRAVALAAAVPAAELVAGTVLVFHVGMSWNVFVIWLTFVAYLPLMVSRAWNAQKRRSIGT